jgi:hypothetical protein
MSRCQTLSYGQIVTLARRAGFPDPQMAAAIAMAESGGNTCAKNVNTNGSTDRGLFQINSIHGSLSTFNLAANVRSALKISNRGRSWSPWVTYQNGAYREHLKRGAAGAPLPAGLAAGGGAGSSGSSGAEIGPEQRSAALKALLWVLFVLGGAGLVLFGASRALGLKVPLPIPAAGAARGAGAARAAAPRAPAKRRTYKARGSKLVPAGAPRQAKAPPPSPYTPSERLPF